MKIGYVRVSTDKQELSPQVQRAKIEAYCQLKDWTLDEVITDLGESAKSLMRPGLQRLLALIDAGQVEALVIYKLDRLTRSVADLNHLLQRCEAHGTALVSVQELLDTASAGGRLVINILASVSQWEREVIQERTRAALSVAPSTFTDQSALTLLQEMQAAGATLRDMVAELNARGVPTARGGVWHETTVRKILGRVGPKSTRKVA